MSDPIAKCRCGRLFSPMQWAELATSRDLTRARPEEIVPTAIGGARLCPCGLLAVKIAPITYDEVKEAYEQALKEGEED